MISTILIGLGVAGLAVCGFIRIQPYLKSLVPARKGSRGLVDTVEAYAVLQAALLANGSTAEAEELRTKILPAAVKEVVV